MVWKGHLLVFDPEDDLTLPQSKFGAHTHVERLHSVSVTFKTRGRKALKWDALLKARCVRKHNVN